MAENTIDIALVDIRMPGISGLEAINVTREQGPQTFYYVMSGFSEFEYAREAIRLNVTEYLLKPLEPEAPAAVIDKVRAEKANQLEQVRDAFRAWLEGTLHRHEVGCLYSRRYYTAILLLTYDSSQEDRILTNLVLCLFRSRPIFPAAAEPRQRHLHWSRWARS